MLFDIYARMCDRRLPEGDRFLATQLDSWSGVWLAIDCKSQPALLFANGDQTELGDMKLQLVDVVFSKNSQITDFSGSTTSGVFTVVRLNDNDPDLAHVFLRLLEVAFLELQSDFSNRSIRREIVRLAELFRRAESDLNDTIGLWGELLVIEMASQTEAAVRSWCSNVHAKFDFVSPLFSLEVKATLKSRRVHRFSLDQVRPSSDQSHYVASILLLEKPDGRTVGAFADMISEQISDLELKGKFLKLCFEKAGQHLYRSDLKIGVLPRGASLAIFTAEAVPVPVIGVGQPISNIRFDVDLSDVEVLTPAQQRSLLRFAV
jgi:hypothetical protein